MIVPANTYIASILAISENGLKPVLVEPDPETLEIDDARIEEAITERTRSVMIVHLYGRCAYTQRIADICNKYHLKLVEDNAQAHGCRYLGEPAVQESAQKGKRTGSLGDAAGHSFYPGKNLGALGDGGAVTTDNQELAEVIRALANYGSHKKYVFQYKAVIAVWMRFRQQYLMSSSSILMRIMPVASRLPDIIMIISKVWRPHLRIQQDIFVYPSRCQMRAMSITFSRFSVIVGMSCSTTFPLKVSRH